jgi:hypothetical protein
MRAARSEYDAPFVRAADASDIGPQRPARYGQNDREIAMTRKNYLFAGSDSGGARAGAMYTLTETAKMNGINPEGYLRDVLARIADHPRTASTSCCPGTGCPGTGGRAADNCRNARRASYSPISAPPNAILRATRD